MNLLGIFVLRLTLSLVHHLFLASSLPLFWPKFRSLINPNDGSQEQIFDMNQVIGHRMCLLGVIEDLDNQVYLLLTVRQVY